MKSAIGCFLCQKDNFDLHFCSKTLVYSAVEGVFSSIIDWISASEGEKFSESVKMMVNRIKDLGPAPLKKQLDAEG